jgi:hypothetical protein
MIQLNVTGTGTKEDILRECQVLADKLRVQVNVTYAHVPNSSTSRFGSLTVVPDPWKVPK